MQIVVTFSDFEEMDAFARGILERKPCNAAELNETAKETAEIINRAEAREAAEKAAKKTGLEKHAGAAGNPADEEEKAPDAPESASGSEVSETEVKLLLSDKLKAGKKAAIKELFGKYGVEKLSELIEKHPDKLGDFYKEAEVV